MGTNDLPERELIQGLIKLAAAYVHATRGNPRGVEKNLRGALARIEAGVAAGPLLRIDAAGLAAAIEVRLRSGGVDDPPMIGRGGAAS
jgi:predicted metal-dependent hydrolase